MKGPAGTSKFECLLTGYTRLDMQVPSGSMIRAKVGHGFREPGKPEKPVVSFLAGHSLAHPPSVERVEVALVASLSLCSSVVEFLTRNQETPVRFGS